MAEQAFIALGSNVDDPRKQVRQAIESIASLPRCTLLKVSPLYETAPMGYLNQNIFLNAVVLIKTTLEPFTLLRCLQNIENAQGRIREIKNGPRTIDCDLILYGLKEMSSSELTLPHPGLVSRDFVLKPLLDIAPQTTLPDGRVLVDILEQLEQRYVLDSKR